MAKAIPCLLTGKPFNAATAEELNLVSEAVATGKQYDRAYELTVEISNAAPLGVQALLASALDGHVMVQTVRWVIFTAFYRQCSTLKVPNRT